MTLITRFAPSPTGMLHIGSARTALFNWLYSKHCNGKFLLRIEDTDKERSTPEAKKQIIDSLTWLGINWDDGAVIQSEREARHREVAEELVARDMAYYCYMTQEEIDAQKKDNPFASVVSPWRDKKGESVDGVSPVVRMKFPLEGETSFVDTVQGEIKINNSELNDIIILRSDGSPTYLLAVVVDDHDMGVNYVIRGDDHITNTFKQILIYKAMGWDVPQHAHIPLIHGEDGSKLSKRHGALGVENYRDLGYLPEALCNYLMRLGWGGDGTKEILTQDEAIELFDIGDVNKSPARLDLQKLNFINSHYINSYDEEKLFDLVMSFWKGEKVDDFMKKARSALHLFKTRASTLIEIANMMHLLVGKVELDEKSTQISKENAELIKQLAKVIEEVDVWSIDNIKNTFKAFAKENNLKDPLIMQCLRASIIGTFASPGIYEMMAILTKEDCLNRINE